MKVVAIYWKDSESVDEWQPDSYFDAHILPQIISIGILQKEDSKYYILSLNRDMKNKTSSCTIIIPKFAVSEVRQIGVIDNDGKFKRTNR